MSHAYRFLRFAAVCLIASSFAGVSAAQTALVYDPALELRVRAANGQTVVLKGPRIGQFIGDQTYTWRVESVQKSPDGRFTVVHYLGNLSKYWDSAVYLIHPDGQVLELSDRMVRSVVWSHDGNYVLGFGLNTFRMWNLVGGVRKISFDTINSYNVSKNIVTFDVTNNVPCESGTLSLRLIKKFSIPVLKELSSVAASQNLECGRPL